MSKIITHADQHLHCATCAWEGKAKDCDREDGYSCPICLSPAIPYEEWLTDSAEDR